MNNEEQVTNESPKVEETPSEVKEETKEVVKETGFVLTDDNIPKFKEPLKPLPVEQKKKGPSLIIILLLVALIIGGGIFGVKYYMDSKNKKENPEKVFPPTDTITFTDAELESLLTYLPFSTYSNLFESTFITKDAIDPKILLYKAISNNFNNDYECSQAKPCAMLVSDYQNVTPETSNFAILKNSKIDEYLLKMYNTSINNYTLTDRMPLNYGTPVYYYFRDGFYAYDATPANYEYYYKIRNYEIVGEDVNINIYVAGHNLSDDSIYDFINKDLKYSKENYLESNAKSYFEDHSEEFTLYQNNYLKGENGYYWNSTTVLEQ